jgi:hypothetical protein
MDNLHILNTTIMITFRTIAVTLVICGILSLLELVAELRMWKYHPLIIQIYRLYRCVLVISLVYGVPAIALVAILIQFWPF